MSVLKGLFAVVALIVVALAGTYAYLSRDIAPSHPALAAASLPRLIPLSDFYADMRAEWIFRISPDGQKVAWHAAGFGVINIKVAPVSDPSEYTLIKVGELDDMYWHADAQRVVVATEGRLWAINPDSTDRENWDDVTPRGFNNSWIIRGATAADDRAVVISNDRQPEAYDVYTVDWNGGDKKLLLKNPGDVSRWIITPTGDLAVRRREDGESQVIIETIQNDDSWSELLRYSNTDDFYPVLVSARSTDFFALSNIDRDLLSLVQIDTNSGKETLVAAFPDADASDAMTFYHDSTEPDLLISFSAKDKFMPISDEGRKFFEAIQVEGRELVDLELTAVSEKTRKISFRVSYDGKFWINKLYDSATGAVSFLGQGRFGKYDNDLANAEQIRFEARDGLSIPAVLTRPATAIKGAKYPAIIKIHGGPASHDGVGYNGDDQFMVNRGYVLLSVNFRGSTGFGKQFRAEGYGQTGRKMQDDITDAARWLIDQGIADPDNIVVKGGSYGGYSAALAMTRDPGLFKAAIVDVAVTDVPYQMNNNPFAWGLEPDEIKRYFGDPENEDDLQVMQDLSPVTLAGKIHGPVLLSHGKRDRVVGFEQSENFEKALIENNKTIDAHYFEHEGHGYRRWQSNVFYWRRLEKFLAGQIGGRDGGFDYVELGPKIFGE